MEPKKRLMRDGEEGLLAGVLAGLAKYFDQDPVLFRLVAIVFIVLTGIFPGALIYFIAWLIMPKEAPVEFTVIE